jgi:pyrophosphate--fructose-6-phosphate 1-phosphotransferase
MNHMSPLQSARLQYRLPLPSILKQLDDIGLKKGEPTTAVSDIEEIRKCFPKTFGQPLVDFNVGGNSIHASAKTVGVVFSGGQAAGGHNVVTGLFDALKILHPGSRLFGFLGGPSGIIKRQVIELTEERLELFRNQGGFDLLGSGRTKIETEEQLKASLEAVKALNLDGLVVIGGDDSNTNAAVLAEYFQQNLCRTQVIGVPKTIDGDLKNEQIEISFGFDTACKVYSELIGNILRDCLSAKKYYHFIKLMGRTASHITLECALKTHPTMALISEEIAQKNQTLLQLTEEIADRICERAKEGKNYGAILIPEGLIEFIPEVKQLIAECNQLLAEGEESSKFVESLRTLPEKIEYLIQHLSQSSEACFKMLPDSIQSQLLSDRDPHGNVQVSLIATEQLLMILVDHELKKRKSEDRYSGSFNPLPHFFGYEGRCSLPSNFDSHYCYTLGYGAALLVQAGLTGYMSVVHQLTRPIEEWQVAGVPITMMLNLEKRHGKMKPVIRKALVDLNGKAFAAFKAARDQWAKEDSYTSPGPIQFFGPSELTDSVPLTLAHS